MKIMVSIYTIRETCDKIIDFINIKQKEEHEALIKKRMSGWFAYTSRESAEESIKESRRYLYFIPKFTFNKADAEKMLKAISFCAETQQTVVELTSTECLFLYNWRKALKLDQPKELL